MSQPRRGRCLRDGLRKLAVYETSWLRNMQCPNCNGMRGFLAGKLHKTSSLDKYELLNMWPEFEGARAARAQEGQRSSEGKKEFARWVSSSILPGVKGLTFRTGQLPSRLKVLKVLCISGQRLPGTTSRGCKGRPPGHSAVVVGYGSPSEFMA